MSSQGCTVEYDYSLKLSSFAPAHTWARDQLAHQLPPEDTASRGPTTIVTPKSQFRTCPMDHGCEGERQYRTHILPAGIVATMRRVVNYHSSCARQQHVELFDASVALRTGVDPMSLRGLVCFFVVLFPGNPGSTAGRGFNPAGGAP
ncbi:putative histone-arginine methyltransferase 1.3-like [Dorcoceras hygrometricum]|uniref:Putative histone-arginine methyltransferase 1.3-like n=1 Tax=Dorcoceras hygrometricum TaxID=472368 RepID=A0A2Z7BE27_9LAMI|nr:putative histone-arginine methyltransferase 1.3-like [Dorcoceras hygrometricum]